MQTSAQHAVQTDPSPGIRSLELFNPRALVRAGLVHSLNRGIGPGPRPAWSLPSRRAACPADRAGRTAARRFTRRAGEPPLVCRSALCSQSRVYRRLEGLGFPELVWLHSALQTGQGSLAWGVAVEEVPSCCRCPADTRRFPGVLGAAVRLREGGAGRSRLRRVALPR